MADPAFQSMDKIPFKHRGAIAFVAQTDMRRRSNSALAVCGEQTTMLMGFQKGEKAPQP